MQRRTISYSLLTLITLLIVISLLWMRPAQARIGNADFVAPMSKSEAQAALVAAQAQQMQLRRQLGLLDPKQLPFSPTVYVAETGHHLSDRSGFLTFWRANGQKVIFGYPISEELVENGRIVQYFERARFEFNPASPHASVQLGLIGSELVRETGLTTSLGAAFSPTGATEGTFPETGHSLSGELRRFWERHGGIGIFGFPISTEFEQDGRVVQYFERGRLEWWPEDVDSFFRNQEAITGFNLSTLYEVRVSDLGRRLAAARGIKTEPVAQLPGTPIWSPALWDRHIDVDLTNQYLTAYEGDLAVWTAPIATGRDGFNTPVGDYAIYYRLPMQDMVGNMGGESWYVPHIPWVQYVVGGVALHGTYWHDAHGTGVRMSHGCINLRIDDAQWLYEWADVGTTVQIHY
ncbi:L,D-transpeptidase [Candidatus Oscillochloris fontis]|uniref:L,D-transpeptidase n=1 Tax=Candidatus Oscillochloris fontis TaxID=2496868 RepID=UPI00101B6618|nr:L,D-transpeptidase [Candidatus Oscillochloris fontis]